MSFFIKDGKFYFLGTSGRNGASAYKLGWVSSKWGALLVTGNATFDNAERIINNPFQTLDQDTFYHNGVEDVLVVNRQTNILSFAERTGPRLCLVNIPRAAIKDMGLIVCAGGPFTKMALQAVEHHCEVKGKPFDPGIVYRGLSRSSMVAAYIDAFMENQEGVDLDSLFESEKAIPVVHEGSYNPSNPSAVHSDQNGQMAFPGDRTAVQPRFDASLQTQQENRFGSQPLNFVPPFPPNRSYWPR